MTWFWPPVRVAGGEGGSHDPGHLVGGRLGQRGRRDGGAGEGGVEVLQPLGADLQEVGVDDAGRAVAGVTRRRETLEQGGGRRGLDGPRRDAPDGGVRVAGRRCLRPGRGRGRRGQAGDGRRRRNGRRGGHAGREDAGHWCRQEPGHRRRDGAGHGRQRRIDGAEQLRRTARQAGDGEVGIGGVDPRGEGGAGRGGEEADRCGRHHSRPADGGGCGRRAPGPGGGRRPERDRRCSRAGEQEQGGGRGDDEALHLTLQRRAALVLYPRNLAITPISAAEFGRARLTSQVQH